MTSTGPGWWLQQVGRIPLLTPAQEIELGTAVQAWLQHPAGPDQCPPGVRRCGMRARERFVAANLRLAVSYVSRHCHRLAKGHSHDDLIQAANEGLIKAVEKFDPCRGYRFSTYAYWWIRQAVNAWADHHSRVVSIPVSHNHSLGRLSTIRRRLFAETGREPSREDLAAALGVSLATFDEMLRNARSVASLDAAVGDGEGLLLGETLATWDQSLEDAEAQQEQIREVQRLQQLLQRLPKRQREAVSMAWGLEGEPGSRAQVARLLGMSRRDADAWLRQIRRELQNCAVQLVLVSVPIIPLPKRARVPRRRRPEVMQLVFPFAGPVPIGSGAAVDLPSVASY